MQNFTYFPQFFLPILSVWLSPVFREELYSQPCYHAPTLSWLMKGFQHFSLSLSIFKCCDKLNKFKCVFNSFLGDLSWFQKNFSRLQKKEILQEVPLAYSAVKVKSPMISSQLKNQPVTWYTTLEDTYLHICCWKYICCLYWW